MKRSLLLLSLLALVAAACTPTPRARMIGVSGVRVAEDTTSFIVLVEIENPTRETLVLSGFDYEVEAKASEGELFTARGSYGLARLLGPGQRDVIEVPLPAKNLNLVLGAPGAALEGVDYRMQGRLRAWRKGAETSWRVEQTGKIEPIAEVGPERRDHRGRAHITVKAVVKP